MLKVFKRGLKLLTMPKYTDLSSNDVSIALCLTWDSPSSCRLFIFTFNLFFHLHKLQKKIERVVKSRKEETWS